MKILELLNVMPDEEIAALAIVPVMFIGMRLLYGAWPWESRKTWYRTKPFVPVMAASEQINSEAEEAPHIVPQEQISSEARKATADTDSDHFDRKLMSLR